MRVGCFALQAPAGQHSSFLISLPELGAEGEEERLGLKSYQPTSVFITAGEETLAFPGVWGQRPYLISSYGSDLIFTILHITVMFIEK